MTSRRSPWWHWLAALLLVASLVCLHPREAPGLQEVRHRLSVGGVHLGDAVQSLHDPVRAGEVKAARARTLTLWKTKDATAAFAGEKAVAIEGGIEWDGEPVSTERLQKLLAGLGFTLDNEHRRWQREGLTMECYWVHAEPFFYYTLTDMDTPAFRNLHNSGTGYRYYCTPVPFE